MKLGQHQRDEMETDGRWHTSSVSGFAKVPYVYTNDGYKRLPFYEQSVTVIATLDGGEDRRNVHGKPKRPKLPFGLTDDDLPLVIGVGIAVIILIIILLILIIYQVRKHRNKKLNQFYGGDQSGALSNSNLKHENNNGLQQSETMEMLTPKEQTEYLNFATEDQLTRSNSEPIGDKNGNKQKRLSEPPGKTYVKDPDELRRPRSQLVGDCILKYEQELSKDSHIDKQASVNVAFATDPSEVPIGLDDRNDQRRIQSCEFLDNSGGATKFQRDLFNSSEEVDEPYFRDRCGTMECILSSEAKTRSLPSWVKSKNRPLSTADDIKELHEKVNYTKKRKNRMKNESAAVIAFTRSKTNVLLHTDRDSLVDNEAMVVYDERTAL